MYLSNILILLDVWYVENRGKVRGTDMKLTERELDVLACILVGEKSLRSTAKLLHISHSAVGTYFQRALDKTRCETKDGLKNQVKMNHLKIRYELLQNPTNIWHKLSRFLFSKFKVLRRNYIQ